MAFWGLLLFVICGALFGLGGILVFGVILLLWFLLTVFLGATGSIFKD